jgi:hypothetical protein
MRRRVRQGTTSESREVIHASSWCPMTLSVRFWVGFEVRRAHSASCSRRSVKVSLLATKEIVHSTSWHAAGQTYSIGQDKDMHTSTRSTCIVFTLTRYSKRDKAASRNIWLNTLVKAWPSRCSTQRLFCAFRNATISESTFYRRWYVIYSPRLSRYLTVHTHWAVLTRFSSWNGGHSRKG